jgi:DNA segregation ATPase FtsK/SpoIIIE-like protein
VLDLEPPAPEAIAGRWHASSRSTAAVIGECYDGPFGIDLRRDGPHALIAGTSGARKSELLQTLIATLAIGNRPDAMNFVLVDYKGGSAFKDCVHLPHTVGMVTDLDAHPTQRALTSLAAELTRRERILAAAQEAGASYMPRATEIPRNRDSYLQLATKDRQVSIDFNRRLCKRRAAPLGKMGFLSTSHDLYSDR